MQHRPKKFWMPHWPIPYGNRDINLGLQRMRLLMEKLDNPQNKLPPIIHVAGTNGKGSTLAYLQSIFETAGYRVHKYISPHLTDFCERITLAGNFISKDFLTQLAEECRIASESDNIPMTFFEGITAIAFLAFSRVPADVLLLEVGMGGRLDATNIVEKVLASIITSISFDHMEFLGNTISNIATEKAGILKRDTLSIFSWQLSEAMNILRNTAQELNCKQYACGYDWSFSKNENDSFNVNIENKVLSFPKPSLIGIHQYINASTSAVTALQIMKHFPKITIDNIAQGISSAVWPARMERISRGILFTLLPLNIELWLDGAHNEAGAQMLLANLNLMKPDAISYMIHGRTIHRDMKIFLQHFVDMIELVSAIEIMGEPDSENPQRIQSVCGELGILAIVSDSINSAVQDIVHYHINKYGNDVIGRIVICGSLFLAGDVMLANRIS